MKFRIGALMGIPYDQALAAGLSSALKGPEEYAKYASSVKPTTPSERLLGHMAAVLVAEACALPAYKANRPHVPFKWPDEETRKGAMAALYGDTATQEAAIMFNLSAMRKYMTQPVHTSILKPARKEKPE